MNESSHDEVDDELARIADEHFRRVVEQRIGALHTTSTEQPLSMMQMLEYEMREFIAARKVRLDNQAAAADAEQRIAALTRERDEMARAHAASFGELVNISLLTKLGGEVDEYTAVTAAVVEIVRERDAAREQVKRMREALHRARPFMQHFSTCTARTGFNCICNVKGYIAELDAALAHARESGATSPASAPDAAA